MDDFNWAPLVPLIRVMWRSTATRARGVVALDRRFPGRGTELGRAIALLEGAEAYDADAMADIALTREAAKAGNLEAQRQLRLYRYVNEARKTSDEVMAPLPTVASDPYHRLG